MQKRFVILLSLVGVSQQIDAEASEKLVLDAIAKVSLQLENFNLHYVTKLEDKFVNIMQTMNGIDNNVKQLQEKAQVWDVFRHHISAWSEHIKTSDQKIEILKRSLENLPVIENQLQNTDFKVQHVFEKADLINEKLHELTKTLLESRRPAAKPKLKPAQSSRSWSQEDFEQTEILMRLSKIQRILQNTCSSLRIGKEVAKTTSGETTDDESASLKTMIARVNGHLEKIPVREIRQTFHLAKKNEKALETLTSVASQIDERTIRIFDTNSYQYKKLLSCCSSTEHEVLTFTNNANTLLKRTEKAIKAVEAASTVVLDEKSGANGTEARSSQSNEPDGSGASGEIDEETLDDAGMEGKSGQIEKQKSR